VDDESYEEMVLEELDAEPEFPDDKMSLQLLKNVKLKYKGPVTGTEYIFDGAGTVVDVYKEDAEIMLQKIPGAGCCPGSGIGNPTPYFRLIER